MYTSIDVAVIMFVVVVTVYCAVKMIVKVFNK
jgi:hypothetical protein